jgi:hypothetical protein
MPKNELKGDFLGKLKDFGMHVFTVIFDIGLAGVWLVGEYCLEHFLVPRFHVDSFISVAALWIFRILFAVLTLIPCASNILTHIQIVLLRNRDKVRQVKTELETPYPREELRGKPVTSISKAEGQR